MSKSTPISSLPDENNDLVQQVLDEVELSKQESERGYSNQPSNMPYMAPIQTEQNMGQNMMGQNMMGQNMMGQNMMGQFPMQNNLPFMQQQIPTEMTDFMKSETSDDSENLFLGFTISHLKNTIVVLILFIILHLPFLTSFMAKYLSFMINLETGNITIIGVLIKAFICTIIFLLVTRFL